MPRAKQKSGVKKKRKPPQLARSYTPAKGGGGLVKKLPGGPRKGPKIGITGRIGGGIKPKPPKVKPKKKKTKTIWTHLPSAKPGTKAKSKALLPVQYTPKPKKKKRPPKRLTRGLKVRGRR